MIAFVAGAVVTVASATGLAVGGGLLWLDQTQRDNAGFVSTDTVSMRTTGYALVSDGMTIDTGGWTGMPHRIIGDARVRVEPATGDAVFVGLARTGDVNLYLAGVGYSTVQSFQQGHVRYIDHAGTPPSATPADAGIWRVQASGTGPQTITWPVESGAWTVVVMSSDASAGVNVRASVGATAPILDWLWIAVIASAGTTFLLGILLVVLAIPRSPRVIEQQRPDTRTGAGLPS